METTIDVNLKAEIKFDEEADIYVAHTPIFDIYSQGESVDSAKLALEDAVNSFLMVAYENGLLGKCLTERT